MANPAQNKAFGPNIKAGAKRCDFCGTFITQIVLRQELQEWTDRVLSEAGAFLEERLSSNGLVRERNLLKFACAIRGRLSRVSLVYHSSALRGG